MEHPAANRARQWTGFCRHAGVRRRIDRCHPADENQIRHIDNGHLDHGASHWEPWRNRGAVRACATKRPAPEPSGTHDPRHFWDLILQVALDTHRQSHRARWTSDTGAMKTNSDDTLFIHPDQLDIAAIRLNHRPELVEDRTDTLEQRVFGHIAQLWVSGQPMSMTPAVRPPIGPTTTDRLRHPSHQNTVSGIHEQACREFAEPQSAPSGRFPCIKPTGASVLPTIIEDDLPPSLQPSQTPPSPLSPRSKLDRVWGERKGSARAYPGTPGRCPREIIRV